MQVFEINYTDHNYFEQSKLILKQSKAIERAEKLIKDKVEEIDSSEKLRVVTEDDYIRRTDSYGSGRDTVIIESKCPIIVYKTPIDGKIHYRLFYIVTKNNKDYTREFTVSIKDREVEE